MAGQPTIVSDYIALILRAIDDTQKDPARLRNLVYEITRLSLGKHVLANYRELGGDGLKKYVVDLEAAIKEAETISQAREKVLSNMRLDVQLLGGSVDAAHDTSLTTPDEPNSATEENKSSEICLPVPVQTTEIQSTEVVRRVFEPPELLRPIEIWEPAFGRRLDNATADRPRRMELIVAALIGIAIYGVMLTRSEFFPTIIPPSRLPQAASPTQPIASGVTNSTVINSAVASVSSKEPRSAKDLGYPLPIQYGVYAVSEGKLYGLDLLPMRVPDPRVAISAMIQTASSVTLPDGKLEFVVFRRDLASSAPMEVFVRVVAKVARATEFSGNAAPKTTDVQDEWAVRNKSYEFRVGPVGNNPEMISLRPADDQLTLPPGRYALVIGGQGYDFAIKGAITDTAQCLERTQVVGGAVYSECRALPKSGL